MPAIIDRREIMKLKNKVTEFKTKYLDLGIPRGLQQALIRLNRALGEYLEERKDYTIVPNNRRLPENRRDAIARAYSESTLYIRDIATEFGVSTRTVKRIAREKGLNRNGKGAFDTQTQGTLPGLLE